MSTATPFAVVRADISITDPALPSRELSVAPCVVRFEKHNVSHPDEASTGKVLVRMYMGTTCYTKVHESLEKLAWGREDPAEGSRLMAGAGDTYLEDMRLHLLATKGSVGVYQDSVFTVPRTETVTFLNTDKVATKFPMYGGISVEILSWRLVEDNTRQQLYDQARMDEETYNLRHANPNPDDTIDPVIFWVDPFFGDIRCTYKVVATLRVTYNSAYKLLEYTPEAEMDGELYLYPSPEIYGALVAMSDTMPFTYVRPHSDDSNTEAYSAYLDMVNVLSGVGLELSSKGYSVPPQIVTWAVVPPAPLSLEIELYRVTSVALVGPDGAAERPFKWPSNVKFPEYEKATAEYKPAYRLDRWVDTSAEIERVHEMGWLVMVDHDKFGNIRGNTVTDADGFTNQQGQFYQSTGMHHVDPASRFLRTSSSNVPFQYPYEYMLPEDVLYEMRTEDGRTTRELPKYKRTLVVRLVDIAAKIRNELFSETLRGVDQKGDSERDQVKAATNYIVLSMLATVDFKRLARELIERHHNDYQDLCFEKPLLWGLDKTWAPPEGSVPQGKAPEQPRPPSLG